jgi:hypothetical protein
VRRVPQKRLSNRRLLGARPRKLRALLFEVGITSKTWLAARRAFFFRHATSPENFFRDDGKAERGAHSGLPLCGARCGAECPNRQAESPRPLALTDEQMSALLRAAGPLPPDLRSPFLAACARALQGRLLGDGEIFRVIRETQREFWRPPDLGHAARGVSRVGRSAPG